MANVKITQLPLATTPLTGTEVFPLVQGTTTKQVAITGLFTSPVMTNPTLGTVGQADLINATGLPISTGVAGLGTGVATFLGTPSSTNLRAAMTDETGTGSLVFATSPTLVTPNLGTPSVLVATNATGTAVGLIAGSAITNANLTGAVTSVGNATSLGSFTSAQLRTALTDDTGSGVAVFATSPTITAPILNQINDTNNAQILGLSPTTSAVDYLVVKNGIGVGVPLHFYADGASANIGLHIQPKGTGLVTISDGADFNKGIRFRSSGSAASTITLLDAVATAGRVVTLPDATTTLVGRDTTDTLTNKTIAFSSNTFSGTLAIANGGTNASTAASAIENLLPSYTGNGSKGLRLNSGATAVEWVADGGGDVVGPASAVANSIALINSTTGKLIKDSSASDGLIYGLTVGRGLGAIDTNTALGNVALATNTTGVQNTAVGRAALNGNTTGSNNTAVGRSALQVTTASDNTAVGHASLQQTTTGASNTAFGAQALISNTTASNNTAIGHQAGYTNITGVITALGWRAGYTYNTNATENFGSTFLGSGSGITTSSGIDNTFVGASAGRLNLTGGFNIALGGGSLYSNTTASNNVAVGYQAGYTNITGANSVYVGFKAGFASTSGLITAIGYQALLANTTGRNTAIGFNSSSGTTTGSNNTSVGDTALAINTTGSNNTALGYNALLSSTTASNNTAVGYQAGYTGTTTADNVFVGYQSGFSATTGTGRSVAVGSGALYTVSTGTDNTAVGYFAGNKITTGNSNAFFGGGLYGSVLSAGNNTTTGNYNTGLGAGALASNTTASNNTAVGYQAGYSTTGANNTAIGYQAGYTNQTSTLNTFLGYQAGFNFNTTGSTGNTFLGTNSGLSVTTGTGNTFVGCWSPTRTAGAGQNVTTGSNNTILGGFDGNFAGLDIRTASNYIVLSDGAGNPLISTNSTRSVALNGAVPQTGTGITFPATQSASSDANTLDDYEEGTFTPVLEGTTTAGTGTYTTQNGFYTKIGNKVFIQLTIRWTAHTGTGNMKITGLPFTSNGTGVNPVTYICYFVNIALTALNYPLAVQDQGTSVILLRQAPTGGGADANIPMDTSGNIDGMCGNYFI